MPKEFTKNFADRLNSLSSFPVKEAEDGELIKGGVCLIAPGGRHMKIILDEHRKARVRLTKIEEGTYNGLHPSIDILMQSAAEAYKGNVVGVLLSGMGEDGVEGMRSIKSAHGHTIVQDPVTAVVDSMPQRVIDEGLADEVLHPNKISKRLSGLIN
jgi:two-component system chemotaxis response regulator CheB